MKQVSLFPSLPAEIQLQMFGDLDFPTLAHLARTCSSLKQAAEEVLYRKELSKSSNSEAVVWAAQRNLPATLDKFIAANKQSNDEVKAIITQSYSYEGFNCPLLWDTRIQKDRHPMICQPSALHLASAAGQDEIVSRLLDFGENVNKEASISGTILGEEIFSITPLFLALVNEHASTASLLLDRRADQHVMFDNQNRPMYTALHFAVLANLGNVVQDLLTRYHADVNSNSDLQLLTPIHMAVLRPPALGCLQQLVEADALIDHPLPDELIEPEATALHLLAALDDEYAFRKGMKLLLEAGADIQIKTVTGHNLLQHAVMAFKPHAVQYLLEQGFNPNQGTNPLERPLELMLYEIRTGAGVRVRKEFPTPDPILKCTESLVNAGAVVSFSIVDGFLKQGEIVIANLLYPYVVDPPIKGYWIENNWEMVMNPNPIGYNTLVFLAFNCPPHQKKPSHPAWKMVISWLFSSPHLAHDYTVQFLASNLDLATLSSEDGCDALMSLLSNKCYSHAYHRVLVQGLIDRGIDGGTTDNYGNTYFHHLFDNGRIDRRDLLAVLELLDPVGVPVNLRNRQGWTALHHVARTLHKHIPMSRRRAKKREASAYDKLDLDLIKLKTLLGYGADREIVDLDGNTPLDLLMGAKGRQSGAGLECSRHPHGSFIGRNSIETDEASGPCHSSTKAVSKEKIYVTAAPHRIEPIFLGPASGKNLSPAQGKGIFDAGFDSGSDSDSDCNSNDPTDTGAGDTCGSAELEDFVRTAQELLFSPDRVSDRNLHQIESSVRATEGHVGKVGEGPVDNVAEGLLALDLPPNRLMALTDTSEDLIVPEDTSQDLMTF